MRRPDTPTVRIVPFGDHQEYYFTFVKPGIDKKVLESFIKDLEKKKLRIVKITYLGSRQMIEKWTPVTGKYPTLIVANSPGRASLKNASVCIQAVVGDFKRFTYIKMGRNVVGVHIVHKNYKYLSVSGIGAPLHTVYKKIDTILAAHGFKPESIYRFWNYMENISKNYADFNAARDRYYEKHHITLYPAATGIEAGLGGSSQICIGFEAIKSTQKKAVTTKTVTSNVQNQAWEYGPKFSRAMLIRFPHEGIQKLYISGTSSINKKGKSIYSDDLEKNIRYVLASVKHLLKKNNMNLKNLLASQIYCKNVKVLNTFRRLYTVEKWNFSYNPLITNICRNDLIFEMECVASNLKRKA